MGRSGGGCGCKPAKGKRDDGRMHIVVNAPDAAAFGTDGLPRPPGLDPPTGKTRTVTFPDAQINGSARVDLGTMADARRAEGGGSGDCCCGRDQGERPPIVIDGHPSPPPTPPRKPDDSPGTSPAAAPPRDDGTRTDVAGGGATTLPRPPVATTATLTMPDTSAHSSAADVEMMPGPHAAAVADGCSCATPKKCCCCDEESMPVAGDEPSSSPPAAKRALRPDNSVDMTAGIGGWSAPIGDGPAGEVPPYSREPFGGDDYGAAPMTNWRSGVSFGVTSPQSCPHGGVFGTYPDPIKGGFYQGCPFDEANVPTNWGYFEARVPPSTGRASSTDGQTIGNADDAPEDTAHTSDAIADLLAQLMTRLSDSGYQFL